MDERRPARRRARWLLGVLTVTALVGGSLAAGSAPAVAVLPRTVVSLTFDDGDANQMAAVTTLDQYGLKGTFYIVSGFTGAPGYFTRDQLGQLKAAGHEIGGHTVQHPDLATVSAAEAQRQICQDRVNLSSWGFDVRSFAYPFASAVTATRTAAKNCGYNSARGLGDIKSPTGCPTCAVAEVLPPRAPFYTKAPDQVEPSWTLADLQRQVTQAEAKGGWVQLTFHDICENTCTDIATSPTLFAQFIAWLAPRARTGNTVVQTVGQTIGGATKPVVAAPADPPSGQNGVNGVVNPGLETGDGAGGSQCWQTGGYGVNTPAFSLVSPGRTGSVASRLTVSGYQDGDAKLLPRLDLGDCSQTVLAGHSYSLRSWYTSTTATQFAVYLRDSAGAWRYWTSSPWFGSTAAWTQATWTTPAVPAGYTGMSFGLNLFSNGTLTTDDYSFYDAATAPAVTAAAAKAPAGSTAGSTAASGSPTLRATGTARTEAARATARPLPSGPILTSEDPREHATGP